MGPGTRSRRTALARPGHFEIRWWLELQPAVCMGYERREQPADDGLPHCGQSWLRRWSWLARPGFPVPCPAVSGGEPRRTVKMPTLCSRFGPRTRCLASDPKGPASATQQMEGAMDVLRPPCAGRTSSQRSAWLATFPPNRGPHDRCQERVPPLKPVVDLLAGN